MTYYNTTNEKGEQLKMFTHKTERQEDVIKRLYKQHLKLSASEVWRMFDMPGTPITSIRRAISNLAKKDDSDPDSPYLIKTNEKITGLYGVPECRYERIKDAI